MTNSENLALTIIDAQNDFCRGGSREVPGATAAIKNIVKMVEGFKGNTIFVSQDWHPDNHMSFAENNEGAELGELFTINGVEQMMFPKNCVENTLGAELHKDVKKAIEEKQTANENLKIVYIKKGTNKDENSHSFMKGSNDTPVITDFKCPISEKELATEETIKHLDIKKMLVCGLATDYCVKASVQDVQELEDAPKVTVLLDAIAGVDIKGSTDALVSMVKNGTQIKSTEDAVATQNDDTAQDKTSIAKSAADAYKKSCDKEKELNAQLENMGTAEEISDNGKTAVFTDLNSDFKDIHGSTDILGLLTDSLIEDFPS